MKNWLQGFRIPKTILGIVILVIGYYLDNKTLIDIGWSLIGIGVASKGIKAAQGNDPFGHEKHLLGIPKNKKEQ